MLKSNFLLSLDRKDFLEKFKYFCQNNYFICHHFCHQNWWEKTSGSKHEWEACRARSTRATDKGSDFSPTPVTPLSNPQWPHGQPSEVAGNDQASFSLMAKHCQKRKGRLQPTQPSTRNKATKDNEQESENETSTRLQKQKKTKTPKVKNNRTSFRATVFQHTRNSGDDSEKRVHHISWKWTSSRSNAWSSTTWPRQQLSLSTPVHKQINTWTS
jgi:hypothetical protein